jgi:hypothetical protein
MADIVPLVHIENKIYIIRGEKVMLDRDLAELYMVDTRTLNQAVKRNTDRFPGDFMFALSRDEILSISQIVISLKYSKNVNAFTEQLESPMTRPSLRSTHYCLGGKAWGAGHIHMPRSCLLPLMAEEVMDGACGCGRWNSKDLRTEWAMRIEFKSRFGQHSIAPAQGCFNAFRDCFTISTHSVPCPFFQ